MTYQGKPFLDRLENLLGEPGKATIYPCIRDLVEHGIDLARFSAGEITPQRQDVTQYVAAWSRHAGLSEEQSRDWLIDYCIAMAVSLTKRSPAAIRHSTKSNLRYIHRSAVPFLCECANNRFRAHCNSACPVYADMQDKLLAKAKEALNPKPFSHPPSPVFEPVLPKKVVYQEQFQTGLRLALDEIQKGTKMPRIVEILKERGLKTKTGREWKYAILRNELLDLKNSPIAPPEIGKRSQLPEGPDTIAPPTDGPTAPLGEPGVAKEL